MRPRRPQSPWPLPPRLSCRPLHPLCALASGRSGGCSRSVSGGGCRRGMSVSSGGGRSAGAACAVVKHVVLAVVAMEFRNFFYFFAGLQCYILTFVLCFAKRKKTCGHACMIYNILLLITAPARRVGHTLQRIDRSPGPSRSCRRHQQRPQCVRPRRRSPPRRHGPARSAAPTTAPAHSAPTSRPHRSSCRTSLSLITIHMFSSFVFICMYIYVAEHRRPRSP